MAVPHTELCSCCGKQHERHDNGAGDRSTHWVDDDVLYCFNAAYAEAAWRAASTVDLSHLVLAMSRHAGGRAIFEECGLDPPVLAAVVAAALPPLLDREADTSRPRTSNDLSLVLTVTRQTAALHGSRYLSLRHILGTLLNPPRGLTGGEAVLRWFWAARRFPGGTISFEPGRQRTLAESTGEARTDERQLLFARLERQEKLLEALLQTREAIDSVAQTQPAPVVEDPPAQSTRKQSATVIPLEDLADDEPAEPGQDPDPELEKLGVRRYYLSLDDEVVRAPSIGPRTAARLQQHSITHVKHLLTCDPERLSVRLGARHITASRIVAWKNQARLVCTIPWLRGTHSQLLVGAGYSSIEKILSTDRSVVCAAVMQFSTTKEGQSILRAGPPPEIDRIMRWIENSQQAEPQRALAGGSRLN